MCWDSIQYIFKIDDARMYSSMATRGQSFLLRQERCWASQGASSATELAGLAVHMYAEEEKKSERGPMAAYDELITTGQLRQDARQQATVAALQQVYTDLVSQRAAGKSGRNASSSGLTLVEARKGENKVETGWWKSIFSSSDSSAQEQQQEAVKGLYMYGGVGCGKTMLMDMFATSVPREMNVRCIEFVQYIFVEINVSTDALLCRWKGFTFTISCWKYMNCSKSIEKQLIRCPLSPKISHRNRDFYAWMNFSSMISRMQRYCTGYLISCGPRMSLWLQHQTGTQMLCTKVDYSGSSSCLSSKH